jgi:sugar lactone lactonase YvrE
VTNVLNGTVAGKGKTVPEGTVVRLVLDCSVSPPSVEEQLVVGSGFDEATNAAALVLGPTGVALAADGTLYVADTMRSRIAAIPDALFRTTDDGTGTTVSAGQFLKGPLGLTMAPHGDILTVNDGEITETTPQGQQVNWIFLDSTGSPTGAGALFGLAVQPGNKGIYFVDDDDENQLNLFR